MDTTSKCISKSVSLPQDTWLRAQEQAWTERKSLSKLVAKATQDYLDRIEAEKKKLEKLKEELHR